MICAHSHRLVHVFGSLKDHYGVNNNDHNHILLYSKFKSCCSAVQERQADNTVQNEEVAKRRKKNFKATKTVRIVVGLLVTSWGLAKSSLAQGVDTG